MSRLPAVVRLCFLAGPMLSMIDSSVVNVAVPSIVGGLLLSAFGWRGAAHRQPRRPA